MFPLGFIVQLIASDFLPSAFAIPNTDAPQGSVFQCFYIFPWENHLHALKASRSSTCCWTTPPFHMCLLSSEPLNPISYWTSPFGSPQTMCPKLNPPSFSCQACFSSRVPHTTNCPETWALWLHSSYLINPQLLHVLPFTCSRECSWICLYFSILTATTLVQATFPYDTHYYCSLLTSQPCLKPCSP